MRSQEEYRKILELWEQGTPKKRIGIILNIPRPTVRDCIERYGSVEQMDQAFNDKRNSIATFTTLAELQTDISPDKQFLHATYSYVLGIYLGDGCISKNTRVYRLRIFLDIRYPQIIQECSEAIGRLFEANEIGIAYVTKRDKPSYAIVSVYNKYLPDLFPQHGDGKKYTRTIALEPWQQRIVDAYPLDFWRGLYHSDGSRFSNIVNGTDYPRYQFSNESQDILRIFMNTCDRLELNYSTKTKRAKGYDYPTDVFVSKRKDVQFLDEHIGPKR